MITTEQRTRLVSKDFASELLAIVDNHSVAFADRLSPQYAGRYDMHIQEEAAYTLHQDQIAQRKLLEAFRSAAQWGRNIDGLVEVRFEGVLLPVLNDNELTAGYQPAGVQLLNEAQIRQAIA